MKVLLVGGGGREHALAWALSASPLVDQLLVAPGSDAIAREGRCLPVAADDVDGLVRLAREERVDLVLPGPELPLVLGLADRLEEAGIPGVGPNAAAARLEGSKAFTKAFCARHGIPTAAGRAFTSAEAEDARAHVRTVGAPVVVKADGLAAGKGVTVASSEAEALRALDQAFAGTFGAAGETVLIEECLGGEEVSLFALVDGEVALGLGTARDHKRAFDGDRGPNTGGMGAVTPAPGVDEALVERAMGEIVRPTVAGLQAEGMRFKGVLFAGLMLTRDGPKLLEYNVRFGDPECQALMVRLMTDFGQLLQGVADGALRHMDLRWYPDPAVTVVLASRGYPGSYQRGSEIRGLEAAAEGEGITLFHAGTRFAGHRVFADGGRVLNVTATAPTVVGARARAYDAIDRIDWAEGFCRRDIGVLAP
jgi:phosphoribosylamine--glycine ligase